MHNAAVCVEDGERGDTKGCHDNCGHYSPGDVQSDAAGLLDDAGWLDFNRSPPISPSMPLVSPTMPLRKLSRDTSLLSPSVVKQDEHFLDQDETDFSLPELTDDDVSALVGSTTSGSACPSPLLPPGSTRNNAIVVSSVSTPASPPFQLSAPPARKPAPAHPASSSLNVNDIPDMVSMFSSMYSPSGVVRANATKTSRAAIAPQPPTASPIANQLSILVPAPQVCPIATPFSTAVTAAAPTGTAVPTGSSTTGGGTSVNQFDYFTPPGYPNNARCLDGTGQLSTALFVNAAETLSPTAKTAALFPGGVTTTAQSRAAYAQVQAHAAAAAAAAAMANSAAAINSMSKLNTTYGVPIAPLQRSLHPELKPKVPIPAAATAARALATTKPTLLTAATSLTATASKAAKLSITPDIADFKLVQIFHSFCDPANKLIDVARFHQLLQHHQGKEDAHGVVVSKSAPSNGAGAAANSSGSATKPLVFSQETQRLFKVLDPKGTGFLDLERFMSSFQICNRCTEAKRRVQSAAVVSIAVEQKLMEDVAPVVVRVVPTSYEGAKVKSCEHYQWTWCEGFEKTCNEKCRGTNRHDKCPKYLANCTLWKHKLPPKNRKAKVPENLESPTKKLRHFA